MPPPISWITNEVMSRVTKIEASEDGDSSQTLRFGEKKWTIRAKTCESNVRF